MVHRLLALPSWVKGGLLAGSLPAVVLAAALIVGSAGGHSGSPEQGQAPAASPSPTTALTWAPTATPTATEITSETPAPSEAPVQPVPVQPTPQIVLVEVTPPPPPEPTPPPPPAPVISGEEAKALAYDWLVQQGAEWGGGGSLYLPQNTLGIPIGSIRMDTNTCNALWEASRWTISCELRVCNQFGCDNGHVHIWVYEATQTVTWAEPART